MLLATTDHANVKMTAPFWILRRTILEISASAWVIRSKINRSISSHTALMAWAGTAAGDIGGRGV